MLDALGQFMKLNAESLRMNYFCRGIKRGRKYVCNYGANDPEMISRAVNLLYEIIKRMLVWRVWEIWWVEEVMDELLEIRDRIEVQLRNKYDERIIREILGLVDYLIKYIEEFREYWLKVNSEVKNMIEDLTSGKAMVIIRGEGVSGITVHYGEHITLTVSRVSSEITIKLLPKGFNGITIKVPNVFVMVMGKEEYAKFLKELLIAMKGGFDETDGLINKGKAAMSTSQSWQALFWALLNYGKVRIRINAVNINENDVKIVWYLRSRHKSLKGIIPKNAEKLSKEVLLSFMFTVVLGDGNVRIERYVDNGRTYDKPIIRLTMSRKKFAMWNQLLERLREMGFIHGKPISRRNTIEVEFYSSIAINLANAMISTLPPIIRDILDALSFKKWMNLRQIATMELKYRKGASQVIVAGYGFTVNIRKNTIKLLHWEKDETGINEVLNALKMRYGDEFARRVRVNRSGRRLVVVIAMGVFEKYDDIKRQVVKVLHQKYEEAKDEIKRQIIAKYLKRLTSHGE